MHPIVKWLMTLIFILSFGRGMGMDTANPSPSWGAPSWVLSGGRWSWSWASGSSSSGLKRPTSESLSSFGGGSARPPRDLKITEAVGSSDFSSVIGPVG